MSSPRSHVRGDNGPRRHELPNAVRLDNAVPDTVVMDILNLAVLMDRNDLGTDRYQISQSCPLVPMFGPTYRQILLQKLQEGADVHDEHGYTEWVPEASGTILQRYLEREFGQVYRTRISVMPEDHELGWHIDTDTSVLCRIQIAAKPADSLFEFNRKGVIESIKMNPNESWFINVGWNHRVVSANAVRVVLIAGVDYVDLEDRVPKLA